MSNNICTTNGSSIFQHPDILQCVLSFLKEPELSICTSVCQLWNTFISENVREVQLGQGEYVIFHSLPFGEKKELARETFERVYPILNQYAPIAIANRGSDSVLKDCANRYQIIKAAVKEIDPTLEIVFVPRTLYELVFIRKCIREDLKHGNICQSLSPTPSIDFFDDQDEYDSYLARRSTKLKERKCWHLRHFDDFGGSDHPKVKNVAYRLNRAIVKDFSPTTEGFTQQKFLIFLQTEVAFLLAYHKKCSEEVQRKENGENIILISNSSCPGPTTNFGYELSSGSIKSMGIRSEADAQILRNAIAIECSKAAQKSLFLYRGAIFQKDSPYCLGVDRPYSLSFGTSLFAGCVHDGGATAFHYMRNEKNAYAISLPFDQLNRSPFFVPPTNTIVQLFGDGEIFHGRTGAWKDFDVKEIEGVRTGGNGNRREHLKSDLTKDDFIAQFQHYKSEAIHLK